MVDFEVKQEVYIGGMGGPWSDLRPFNCTYDVL